MNSWRVSFGELKLSEMIAGQLKAYFQNGKGVKGNELYI
ncbi:hypothetical protein CHCC15325_0450 [Bacillus licheniformis]|jgi:hypothetical protein|uniref:Uncharacterized protein n=1 Tax=Bacillus licheniformis TaxID=1402 RepID=A0A8B5Y682_BACLI|nr:hypothetical protein MUY_002335 [Bacillus licheniformis WX-02]EQM27691.1 hypothetical protein N399_12715 [Bacillus licheniformis CG-B52]KUL10909.1 hypothetical protein LI17339_13290 [Bacillus licheniformis LMG 17339]KYC68667.1 hypothetical protein B4092_2418 [Bacillus licheniformis]KYC75763.1 hypothetical protein B4090_2449 [Bacillus licheniformis]